jgi:hypothetical protein
MNDLLDNSFFWLNDDEVLISSRTKEQKEELKIEKLTPVGPVVQESKGQVAQNRTYPELLKNQSDELYLTKAIKAQFVIYNIKKSSLRKLGPEGTYDLYSASPDKKRFLVSRIIKPYSYQVPVGLFAKEFEVWDVAGNKTHTLHKGGPYERIPIEGVITGPRSMRWLPDEPST